MKANYIVRGDANTCTVFRSQGKTTDEIASFTYNKYHEVNPIKRAQDLANELNANPDLCDPLYCAIRAQEIYDKMNWGNATSTDRIFKIAAELQYLRMTGKPLKLTYNCPA